MRLLQITASNVWRGHEQQIVYYYTEFDSKIEHQVLLCPTNTQLESIAKAQKFNYRSLPFKSAYDKAWIRAIKSIIKSDRIDLVLIHSSKAQTLCILSSMLSRTKIPMVFFRTLIKKVDTNFFRRWKYNYKHLRHIVCVSQAVIDTLKPAIDDHSRLSVVGSATDLDQFKHRKPTGILRQELGIDKNTTIIGNVSAFVPFKDHHTLVEAAAILVKTQEHIKFVLAGTGPLEEDIKTKVSELNLDDYFIFLGFRTDISDIFPDFDMFLFTSNNEPTGGVLLEAYASHVPIVACRAGGIPEVIVDGKTGILVAKENPKDVADAVLTIINDKHKMKALKTAGFQHLKTHFTKEIIANKMLDELQQVAKRFPIQHRI